MASTSKRHRRGFEDASMASIPSMALMPSMASMASMPSKASKASMPSMPSVASGLRWFDADIVHVHASVMDSL